MNRKYTLLLILLLLTTASVLYWRNFYTPFYPVGYKGGEYIINNTEPLSESFNHNITQVLKYYDEDYKICHGIVHVKNSLHKDDALMYNYTHKAQDSVWMVKHKLLYRR